MGIKRHKVLRAKDIWFPSEIDSWRPPVSIEPLTPDQIERATKAAKKSMRLVRLEKTAAAQESWYDRKTRGAV